MGDDIVTRLRVQRTNSVICNEAADEIERLRAEVKRWANWASDYAFDDETCECDRCEQVRAAWDAQP